MYMLHSDYHKEMLDNQFIINTEDKAVSTDLKIEILRSWLEKNLFDTEENKALELCLRRLWDFHN